MWSKKGVVDIKFGYCLNMVAGRADKTGSEWIPVLKKLGFDYAELPLAELSALTSNELENVISDLQFNDLPCKVCNNLFPANIKLTGPDVNLFLVESHVRNALSIAKRLGADTVVFGSGSARNVPEGFSMFQAFDQMVQVLKLAAPVAESNGLRLMLEAARSPDTNILHTLNAAYDWLAAADAANVGLLADYFHMKSEHDTMRNLTEYSNLLGHIHIACPRDIWERERCMPYADDGWDYSDLRSALFKGGYRKRISIEAFSDDFVNDARKSIAFMKSLFQ